MMMKRLALSLAMLSVAFGAQAQTPPATQAPAQAQAQESGSTLPALISADSEATLSAQMPGKITKIRYAIGQAFPAGATLVEFDCAETRARLDAQQAEFLGARETHLAKLKLQGLGAAGELEVTLAAAAAEKAKSMIRQQEAQMAYCQVKAPYAGRVVRLKSREAENVTVNQPVMEIVANARRKAVVHVPAAWAARVRPGTTFTIRVPETGRDYPARLERTNGRVDGVSQSLEVEAVFTGKTDGLLPGMIGQARFPDSVTKGR